MNAQWALHIQTEQGSRELALTRPTVTLGRAPDNDVVLQDALVSGHHARLDVGPGGAPSQTWAPPMAPGSMAIVCHPRPKSLWHPAVPCVSGSARSCS